MYRIIWRQRRRDGGFGSAFPQAEHLAQETPPWAGIDLLGNPEPVFTREPEHLQIRLSVLFAGARSTPTLDMTAYFHAFVRNLDDAQRLASRLRDTADTVEIQGEPRPAVRMGHAKSQEKFDQLLPAAPTPNLLNEQGYLEDAPTGIGARTAWEQPGCLGDGISIVDVENGWNFCHEDLVQNEGGVMIGSHSNSDHGTAVLGIVSGDNNAFGVTGIVPNAFISGASAIYCQKLNKWNAADAIRAAADKLMPGSVILLEMHAPGPNATGDGSDQQGFIAIEYWDAEFAAIQYAIAKGIYVVEAAGNGGEDLDGVAYAGKFDRAQRDSGAIIVGGGQSAHDANPRSRIWWSNYGSRLDVQGWGYDIVTTGGRQDANYYDRIDQSDPARCYTKSFGGTSGASPIVVGAVAAVSGYLAARKAGPLSPAAMRNLLATTGTHQEDAPGYPATQRIGALPNLAAALGKL